LSTKIKCELESIDIHNQFINGNEASPKRIELHISDDQKFRNVNTHDNRNELGIVVRCRICTADQTSVNSNQSIYINSSTGRKRHENSKKVMFLMDQKFRNSEMPTSMIT
jgi:hypothetical protein